MPFWKRVYKYGRDTTEEHELHQTISEKCRVAKQAGLKSFPELKKECKYGGQLV
jgi:hypothetical protein